MAKHTYNRVMSAMAEDTTAAMLHTFAALTAGAKAIALQSGKFSNLYIRGERKGMAAEEAAKELTERAAVCVTRKLRKIDMVCAASFLAEYISRQRKAIETPETPNPEPDNTPNVSDLARWIDLQLSTIIEGVSAGYTLGNYNSVWIDKGATVFNVSLANGETVEIDSDNYNTAEEIATAIISTLNNTPSTMNASETIPAAIIAELNTRNDRGAWSKAVTDYAIELAESLDDWDKQPESVAELREMMLNGASDWKAYSWGGCSLVYNQDIAERVCSPSELKRVTNKNGLRDYPNSREHWLDVQARALYQAANRVAEIANKYLNA